MKTDIYIKNDNYEHELINNLIKKSDIIDVIEDITWYSQNRNKDMVSGASNTHEAWYKADDIYNALKSMPSSNDGEMVLIEGDGIFDYYGLLDALLNNGYVVKIKKNGACYNIKYKMASDKEER